MNTSVDNISFNISGDKPLTSSFYQSPIEISPNNITHIYSILAYANLEKNWDSYDAKKPNQAAIVKAINFIYFKLSPNKKEIFFTAPTPDGDILVELKNSTSNLEFIFSGEVEDKIVASCDGSFHAEEDLNETTLDAYLNWLDK